MPEEICFKVMTREEFKTALSDKNLSEVARRLGVSTMTISNLANGKIEKVGLSLRSKVTNYLLGE